MKLIMENWRRFINEDVTPRDLYKLDLNTFVTQIQTNKEEVLKALAAGLDDSAGATSREVMPQADAPQGSQVTAGGTTPAALEPLEQGVIDFRAPYAAGQPQRKVAHE